MFSIENFHPKKNLKEELKKFEKQVIIDDLPYQIYISQTNEKNTWKLDFSVDGTTFLTRKGLSVFNQIIDQIFIYIKDLQKTERIEKIKFHAGWEKRSYEEIQQVFSLYKEAYLKSKEKFNGFYWKNEDGFVCEIKDSVLSIVLPRFNYLPYKNTYNLDEIFTENKYALFGERILDCEYGRSLLNHIDIEDEITERQKINLIDANYDHGDDAKGRRLLYKRVLERKFPEYIFEIDESEESLGWFMVSLKR